MEWDSKSVTEALIYIRETRKKRLTYIKSIINEYTGNQFGDNYYDIIVGDWEEAFMHHVYAAWNVSAEINDNQLSANKEVPLARTMADYADMNHKSSGLYEHIMYSVSLIRGNPEYQAWEYAVGFCRIMKKQTPLRRFLLFIAKSIGAKYPLAIISKPNFKLPHLQQLWLILLWRKWAQFNDFNHEVDFIVKKDPVSRIKLSSSVRKIENALDCYKKLLPIYMPVEIFEAFDCYRELVLEQPIKRPKVLYSAQGLHNNFTFKVLSAEWKEKGTRLLYRQHGGCYGVDHVNVNEEYEARVSDCFYTWGWMRGDGKAAPMKLPPLHRYKISKKIHMLLVCVDFPVSIYRIHYHPMPGLSLDRLHAETINFISQLSTRNGLVVRPYHHTYDKQYAQAVEKVADGALFDRDNNGALFKRFLESEIVVHNYLGTSYIETMMLNVPTICFYDPNVYLFREEARDLMYDLESVGVIHRSAESAVEFMNKIEGKIQDWWLGGDVQFAKDCFLYKYADSSPQWKSNMKYHLLEQVKLAK